MSNVNVYIYVSISVGEGMAGWVQPLSFEQKFMTAIQISLVIHAEALQPS